MRTVKRKFHKGRKRMSDSPADSVTDGPSRPVHHPIDAAVGGRRFALLQPIDCSYPGQTVCWIKYRPPSTTSAPQTRLRVVTVFELSIQFR